MASQPFREESKLKGLSGVKTEQGKAGLNVIEIKQAENMGMGQDKWDGHCFLWFILTNKRGAGL